MSGNPKDRTGFTVNSVTVVIAYETKEGIEEVIHQVDGKKSDILSVSHNIERKVRAMKDARGVTTSYEPSGETVLLLKVKYLQG